MSCKKCNQVFTGAAEAAIKAATVKKSVKANGDSVESRSPVYGLSINMDSTTTATRITERGYFLSTVTSGNVRGQFEKHFVVTIKDAIGMEIFRTEADAGKADQSGLIPISLYSSQRNTPVKIIASANVKGTSTSIYTFSSYQSWDDNGLIYLNVLSGQ